MSSVFDPETQHLDTPAKVVAGLERIAAAMRSLLWEQATGHSLSPLQVQALIFLHTHHDDLRRVGHLAREFGVSSATVSDAVRVLEQKGLVMRVPRADDRRASTLTLTAAGIELAAELASWPEAVYAHLARLPAGAQATAWGVVEQLIEALRAAGVISVARTCRSCRFFAPEAHPKEPAQHHCQLLDLALGETDLRLDCAEHEALAS